jgi:hypothetical protein
MEKTTDDSNSTKSMDEYGSTKLTILDVLLVLAGYCVLTMMAYFVLPVLIH